MPINAEKYKCKICNFICSKQSNWNIHISTAKHKIRTLELDVQENAKYNTMHKCYGCNKEYKSRSALWYHKTIAKKCRTETDTEGFSEPRSGIEKPRSSIDVTQLRWVKSTEDDSYEDLPDVREKSISKTHELLTELLKQNNDLQRQIIELSKEPKTVNNYNSMNTTNNNNNQFNLNLFLNETCKDALNIDDFMDSLELSIEDLEKTGELGFVQGITRIFLNGLKELEVSRRPIHCTDVKRETVYIKDQDKWEKESTEKTKMRQALNQAVRKNLRLIPAWREKHPDYLRSNTKDNDDYIKISLNSLGSEYDDEQKRMDDKIIRNILKEVVLDKKNCIE